MKFSARILLTLTAACSALLVGCVGAPSSVSPSSAPAVTASPEPAATPSPTEMPVAAPVSGFAQAIGYREENATRYEAYAAQRPDDTPQQTVAYVNIGLDREFYTEVEEIAEPGDLLVLCNKYHKLPDGYKPSELVQITSGHSNGGKTLYLQKEAAEAFEQLCEGAAAEGYTILGQSGYRSYDYQKQLYNNYKAKDGEAAADTYSARPGFSEHQTGLAMDICNGVLAYNSFGKTKEYEWAKENLHKYGFILHYLPESQWITGYKTEEWHIRYVGIETATKVYELNITFDEYCATYLEQ